MTRALARLARRVPYVSDGLRVMASYSVTHDRASARTLLAAHRRQAGGRIYLRALAPHPFLIRPAWTDAGAVLDGFVHRDDRPPRDCRCIVDLGAHIGAVTTALAVRCPGARIVAVELDALNIELLRQNVTPWADRVTILHAAIWPEDGLRLAYCRDDAEPSRGRVDARGYPVRSYALTRLVAEVGPVDYLKMDIEGHERLLLSQRTDWAPAVGRLRVEVHEPYTVADCRADLERLGFRTKRDRRHDAVVGWR